MTQKNTIAPFLSPLQLENGLVTGHARSADNCLAAIGLYIDGRQHSLIHADLPQAAGKFKGFAAPLPQRIYDGAIHEICARLYRQNDDNVLLESKLAFRSRHCRGLVSLAEGHYQGWVGFNQRPTSMPFLEIRDEDGVLHKELGLVVLPAQTGEAEAFIGRFRLPAEDLPDSAHFYCQDIELEGSPCHPQTKLLGLLENFNGKTICGWAFDTLNPGKPIELLLKIDHEAFQRFRPNLRRPDIEKHLNLPENGLGIAGFELLPPEILFDGRPHTLDIEFFATRQTLHGSRQSFCLPRNALSLSDLLPATGPKPAATKKTPRPGTPKVSVIVLNRDGAKPLNALLESWHQVNRFDSFEFIVIDHASEDDSLRVLRHWQAKLPIHVIPLSFNDSFSASCNRGAAASRGQYLLFLNNDIVWLQDSLPAMLDTLANNATVGSVGLKLLKATDGGEKNNQVQHLGVRFKLIGTAYWPYETTPGNDEAEYVPQTVPVVTAAVMLCRKSDFLQAGQFDDHYFYGFEDVELGLRLTAVTGKTAVCRNDLVALHRHGHTRLSGRAPDIFNRVIDNAVVLQSQLGLWLKRRYWQSLFESTRHFTADKLTIGFVIDEPEPGAETTALRTAAVKLAKRLQPLLPTAEMLFLPPSRGWYNVRRIHLLIVGHPLYDIRKLEYRREDCLIAAWLRGDAKRWRQLPWLSDFDAYSADSAALQRQLSPSIPNPIALTKSQHPFGRLLNPDKPPLRIALLLAETPSDSCLEKANLLQQNLKAFGCVVWQQEENARSSRLADIRLWIAVAGSTTPPKAVPGVLNIIWSDQNRLSGEVPAGWTFITEMPDTEWLEAKLEETIGNTFRSS